MARLVHIAPERLQRRIERSGLRGEEWTIPVGEEKVRLAEAIFAMPSFPDEQLTYQWVRELRSWRSGARMVAVTFEVDADAELFFGRFGETKKRGGHHDAYVAIEADPFGAEVVVNGPIPKEKVISVRSIRQDIGWQGSPDPTSHWNCTCPACLPTGHPKLMRRLRALYAAGIQKIRGADGDASVILDALSEMSTALERARSRLSPKRLLSLTGHPDPRVRKEVLSSFTYFRWSDVEETVTRLLGDPVPDVRAEALETMLFGSGFGNARAHAGEDPELLEALCHGVEFMDDSRVDPTLDELSSHEHAGVRAAARQVIDWRAQA